MRLIDAEYVLWKVQSAAFPQSVDFGQGRESVLDEIRRAPTVDAEPVRRGKWIEGRTEQYCWTDEYHKAVMRIIPTPICSVCRKPHPHKSKFCEHCGARMEGAEHETD